MLLGMAAAVLPLAIHLFSRGRTRPEPFSDLSFLQQVHQSRMRRIRLRQWIVLLLRTLAILLLAAAFSRPAYQAAGSAWIGSSVPTAAVLLLDRSYSTTYRTAEGRLFDQLRGRAAALIELFSPGDRVTMIPFAGDVAGSDEPASAELLRQHLEDATPSEEATNLRAALSAGSRSLARETLGNRELFLVTDLSHHDWLDPEPLADSLVADQVYVLSPPPRPRPNLFIEHLDISGWMPAAGARLDVAAAVANAGDEPVAGVSADLFIDGERVQRRQADLPARATITIAFAVTPRRAGRITGYVELDHDALPLDNRRYFALDVSADIGVLLLGESSTDTYYPRRALAAAGAADPALRLDSGLFAELDSNRLDTVDVLFLCNLRHLDAGRTRLILDFVRGGGGLVLFPSPLVDMSYLNRELLAPLVPAAVVRTRHDRSQTLAVDGGHHALLDDLLTPREEDRPRFDSWFEMAAQPGLEPLARFAIGHLFLATGSAGHGRVVLAAVPLSDEWSDLSFKGIFAPLMHRLTRHLSQRPEHDRSYQVGDSVARFLHGIPAGSTVAAESPSGDRLLSSPETVAGRLAGSVPLVDESGIWHLSIDAEVVDQFPVNVDTRESRLQPVRRQRVVELLGAERVQFVEGDVDVRDLVLGNRFGRELWREFLVAALLLLLLELWIARAPRSAPSAS